ncbi:protein mono-ADP-ribosyltransferase PARP14-like [Solea solea]|uniref:protein mono-ADP-ribosyltransferase PARP14-like n=1 Tax=Solea solea TaxID=90069 RepID=UPI00272A0CD4|nr:protein mono-ADP-ribosyltransferase PARP14-like [Solea solea]
MGEYQHSLFFEARELADEEKQKIWRYFQKKRDSGGGVCAALESIGDSMYKISFKEIEDQERVLHRKFHTISLPSGKLDLTLSRTNSPQTPVQPLTQIFTKTNTKGLEKSYKIDVFLMHYLRDNPKANKILQKQLDSIGCRVELNFDEEEAMVRGDIEKGPGGAFGASEKWEIQVDRIFIGLTENYTCYHVLDQKQKKMLLQHHFLETGDIKVYRETGYSVIVGEIEDVKEMLAVIENSIPTRKEVPIVKNKYKLVEEEFNREMRAHYPEVKIHSDHDMITMEGNDKQVQSGANKLDELIKKVMEKRVILPSELLTFITSSNAISKYEARFQQSLRHPVSLEVGSCLVLSSLSCGALDEAEAALKRDLSVDTVMMQGTADVSLNLDTLKEILNKAKNELNCREDKVDFSFITRTSETSGSEVRIVGCNESVKRLKAVVQDFQMNQVVTQEVLKLPQPELVDCFEEFLGLIGFKHKKVTIKTSPFPNPCVHISGPRCHVQEAMESLTSVLSSIASEKLVLDGPGAQRYFQTEGKVSKDLVESSYQVLIREQQGVNAKEVRFTSPRPSMAQLNSKTVENVAVKKTTLKIAVGSLEDEQVNVLVVPMVNKNLTSTNIGKSLLIKAGNQLQTNFHSMAANLTISPGDVLQVAGPPSLGCSKLFFIECLPWDGVRARSVQALKNGLKRCLDLCAQQGFNSVALPVIGPGVVLRYPLREAVEVLTDSICQFGSSPSSSTLFHIHVVIKPGYADSEECYHEVYSSLSRSQVLFRSIFTDLDDISVTVGHGVKLQVVFGDITNETTDAVVNTTNFVNFDIDGVCKDILTVAGPQVKAKLVGAHVGRGQILATEPGSFPCKAILHVSGQKDAGVIEQLVCDIVQRCESSGCKSVAIPAICAGAGGMDPGVVAAAIIRGVKRGTSSSPLHCLTDIHLVLIKIKVFLEFKVETLQVFSTAVFNRVPAPQRPYVEQKSPSSGIADLSILHTSFTNRQSVFLILGLWRDDVKAATKNLDDLYCAQCSTQTFTMEQLNGLSQNDITNLKLLVETECLYVQSGQSCLTVSGLKDGVNKVMQMINTSVHGNLKKQMTIREEEDLYSRVAWCIMGAHCNWERLPRTANHKLENKDIAGGIVDTQNVQWNVDLQKMEAVCRITRHTRILKRLENLPDFTVPLYWDNMAVGENMKLFPLQPSSAEYKDVKQGFKLTSNKTVLKIARFQNVHLRQGFEAQKKHLSHKNREQGGAGEKLLYHGTTQENSDSIMKTGFNRSLAGQNATSFGHGSYFAVNASYSAHPTYARPSHDGTQLMFVARVLTGVYTVGQSGLKVPPPRNIHQPHDRYDSVVDRMDNPSMYIVFHDNQAYPDYLITFK